MVEIKKLIKILLEFRLLVYGLYEFVLRFWLYILWILIFPAILHFMNQGNSLISHLFEDGEEINLILVLSSFIIQSFAIWVVPTPSCVLTAKWIGKNVDKLSAYKNVINYLNISPFSIKYLANAPLIVFFFLCLFNIMKIKPGILIVGLCLLCFIILLLILERRKSYQNKLYNFFNGISSRISENTLSQEILTRLILFSLSFLIMVALILIFYSNALESWALIIFSQLILSNFFMMQSLEELGSNNKSNLQADYNISTFIYYVVIGFIVLAILVLAFLFHNNKLHNISPIFVGITMITLYTLFLDTFLKTPLIILTKTKPSGEIVGTLKNNPYSGRKFILYTLTFVWLYFLIIVQLPFHDLRIEKTNADTFIPDVRQNLDSNVLKNWIGLEKWNDQVQDTIILVAGQGGGSRAGAWMNLFLDHFGKDSFFRKKLFAISTVSGSSVGASMVLTKWKLEKQNVLVLHPDSLLKRTKNQFAYNFLSTAFWGLFLNDFINGIYNINKPYDKDRNYYEQMEFINAFSRNYSSGHYDNIYRTMNQDFLAYWYSKTNSQSWKLNSDLPYLFINTANTQKGRRAIFSPVKLPHSGLQFLDPYAIIKDRTLRGDSFNLPYVTAVNTSELFPLISSYSFLESFGNFIDGGIYENTGCNTLYEIFEAIHHVYEYKHKIDSSTVLPHYEFYLVMNYNYEPEDVKIKDAPQSFLIGSLKSILSSPFEGHSPYWYNRVKQLENLYPNVAIHEIHLRHNDSLWTNIPLGRLLLRSEVDIMYEIFNKQFMK
jgi:hypothetical protein